MLPKNKFCIFSLEHLNQTSSNYLTLLNIFSCLHFSFNSAKPVFKHTHLQRVSHSYGWIRKSARRQVWQCSYCTVGPKVEFSPSLEEKLLKTELKLCRSKRSIGFTKTHSLCLSVQKNWSILGPNWLPWPFTDTQKGKRREAGISKLCTEPEALRTKESWQIRPERTSKRYLVQPYSQSRVNYTLIISGRCLSKDVQNEASAPPCTLAFFLILTIREGFFLNIKPEVIWHKLSSLFPFLCLTDVEDRLFLSSFHSFCTLAAYVF